MGKDLSAPVSIVIGSERFQGDNVEELKRKRVGNPTKPMWTVKDFSRQAGTTCINKALVSVSVLNVFRSRTWSCYFPEKCNLCSFPPSVDNHSTRGEIKVGLLSQLQEQGVATNNNTVHIIRYSHRHINDHHHRSILLFSSQIMKLQQSLKRRVGIKGGALGRGSGINPTLGLPQMVPTLGFNRNATMVHGA